MQRTVATVLLLLLALPADPAAAQNRAQEFLRRIPEAVEPEPHGEIRTKTDGSRINLPVDPAELDRNLSDTLSEACSRLRFNQRRQGKYYVIVERPNAPPVRYGYAQGSGLNLYDPERLSGPEQLYLFWLDGTSECRVYVTTAP